MRCVGIAIAFTLAACVGSASTVCDDGRVCPAGQLCASFGCVQPSQVTACDGLADGALCMLPGDDSGQCYLGVCAAIGCGNSIVEASEACDDGNTLGGDGCSARCDSDETCGNAFLDTAKSEGCDCGDADFTGARPPACKGMPNSDDATAICTSECQIRGCGDGVVGGLEDCDGASQPLTMCSDVGYYQGTLGCLSSCRYDVSGCSGRCGDDVLNGPPGGALELCDGADLGGRDCATYGYYDLAGLACNELCGIDTTGCMGYCGDNVFQSANEICDSGESEAQLNARNLDCMDYGYYAPGGLACSDACQIDTAQCLVNGGGYCGDGVRQDAEDCDGSDLDSLSCTSFGYHQAGALACRPNCTFDLAGCSERCGDQMVNGPEQCDGSVPADTDCTSFGFYQPGGLVCNNAACVFDTSGCAQRCGDQVLDPGEQCDATVPTGVDCTDFGYYVSGTLTCSGGCTYDLAGCSQRCGDLEINGAEGCDGSVPTGLDCTDFGYYSIAGLTCTNACSISTSECDGYCGDRVLNGGELCEGKTAEDCVDYGFDVGRLGCGLGCGPEFSACRRSQWTTLPTWGGENVHGIWGAQPDDLFAVTFVGIIRRWNGSVWSSMTTPTTQRLNAVWGSSASNVFAVGDGGTIIRWNGSTWSAMTSGTGANLQAVWGSSDSNVFAVGTNGAIVRFTGTGTTWSPMTSPVTSVLRSVWTDSATNAYAVGDAGKILRYSNSAWTVVDETTTYSWRGVSGRNGSDVFVVGFSSLSIGAIHHWDGSVWSPMTPAGNGAFSAVSATNNTVVAVGPSGHIQRFDGSEWTLMDSDFTPSLICVWGSPTGEVIVGAQFGNILHWDGEFWGTSSLGVINALNALWGASPQDIVAVGQGGTILRWDGFRWTPDPSSGITNQILRGIWGANASDVFVVGSGGAFLRWNGLTWSSTTIAGSPSLNGVWGSSASNVVAVGSNGGVFRYNGSWSQEALGLTTDVLKDVWGSGANDIHVVGDAGRLLHWNGSVWTPSKEGSANLNGVWGSSATDVFAVGGSGTILHWDGTSWTKMDSRSTATFLGVRGNGPADVIAIGAGGTVMHYDGLSWSRWKRVTSTELNDVWGKDDILTVGFNGEAAQRHRSCAGTELRCGDGEDNDCDGHYDCGDSDCASSVTCVSGGLCAGWTAIACGSIVTGTTLAGPSNIDTYACDAWHELGRETVYRLQATTSGMVTVSLSGMTKDLDLIVLRHGAGGGCEPRNPGCVAASSTQTNESVTFMATAGQVYYLVVDGYGSSVGDFTVSVSCP